MDLFHSLIGQSNHKPNAVIPNAVIPHIGTALAAQHAQRSYSHYFPYQEEYNQTVNMQNQKQFKSCDCSRNNCQLQE